MDFLFVEGKEVLAPEDIIYIETHRHKNYFHTKKGVFSIYRKLGEIEADLGDSSFLRVHQSYLVNLCYVEQINSYLLTLKDGQTISVPKSRYQEVKKAFAQYRERGKEEGM